ncbi:LEAF RUST 10 DISEASE-RESISTANCE LOCUS RECEPTOR-LIKE PROTEIN KINASE-like 2.7 [Lotus japonicus]|uniref:LEAF RUST 10 DISEASE-RESISTANCE LOCUS RECEPTOR-LIKE PROTEIN KINASE-like 2.7 n=1 Tax=Lotus japonicus TaxID=34305 RepID=UPI00258DDBDF|nr:LEAF RUST 10 DISEASE-RESISTANCE LOCUS RECEPTOR-LIKE PROTEIN KINASE-like 2.7 [Lotus japonicus]
MQQQTTRRELHITMAGRQIFCSKAFPLFFIVFFFFHFPANVASFTEGYTPCVPFKCGHFENITYPFFNTHQPDYCGHPQFRLDCHENLVTFELNSKKFIVRNISMKYQTLTLATYDLLALDTNCPKHLTQLTDVSLDSAFFNYTSKNDNFTLLYDCKTLPPAESPLNSVSSLSFNCVSDGDPHSHQGYLVSSANVVKLTPMGCKNSTKIPVSIEAFNESIRKKWYIQSVLDAGFEVKWSVVGRDKCEVCLKSGGSCGYNASLYASMCFCPNQQSYGVFCSETPAPPLSPSLSPHYEPHSEPEQSHHALGKWTWERKTIIGLGLCLLAAIAVIIVMHFYSEGLVICAPTFQFGVIIQNL